MSDEIPDGFYDFDEVVREARATYTPEELARVPMKVQLSTYMLFTPPDIS